MVLSSVCDHLYPELEAVASINKAIRLGNAAETVEELMNPEAQLPIVCQTAANLYQNELFSLQLQGGQVSLGACWRRADYDHLDWSFSTGFTFYNAYAWGGNSHSMSVLEKQRGCSFNLVKKNTALENGN